MTISEQKPINRIDEMVFIRMFAGEDGESARCLSRWRGDVLGRLFDTRVQN